MAGGERAAERVATRSLFEGHDKCHSTGDGTGRRDSLLFEWVYSEPALVSSSMSGAAGEGMRRRLRRYRNENTAMTMSRTLPTAPPMMEALSVEEREVADGEDSFD